MIFRTIDNFGTESPENSRPYGEWADPWKHRKCVRFSWNKKKDNSAKCEDSRN